MKNMRTSWIYPQAIKFHDVFHVSLLEKDPTHGESPLDAGADEKTTETTLWR